MAGCDPYSPEQVMALLDWFVGTGRTMYAALLALGVGSGARVSELLQLVRGDLLRGGKLVDSIRLVKLKTNGVKVREVPWGHEMDRYVLPWLMRQQEIGLELSTDPVFCRMRSARPVTRQAVWKMLRLAYAALKMSGRHATHGMRKTFARMIFEFISGETGHMLRALEMTREALGHERLETTIKYLNLPQDDLRQALTKIFQFAKC